VLEFDRTGKFVREFGQGGYGLGYTHSIRVDRYDNMWVVDKGTMSVMEFNPQAFVTINIWRRCEGAEEHHRVTPHKAVPVDHFNELLISPFVGESKTLQPSALL
jgi:hypothetical protein